MRAAILDQYGSVPRVGDFPPPAASGDHVVVDVAAAAIHHVDRLKATGAFYLSPPDLPVVVGSDGMGTLADGRRVYFESVVAPYGALAEKALVSRDDLFDVPADLDDVHAAALGNTGMAAWLALSWRAALRPGETVLVLGAAGALGTVATQAARILGAGRVVGADLAAARSRIVAADASVDCDTSGDLAAELREACHGGAHVIVDTLWGEPALAAMRAAAHGARVVQLGQIAGATTPFPSALLRAARIDLLGFAYVHAPREARRAAYADLGSAVARSDLSVPVDVLPLDELDQAWSRQVEGADAKLVITLPRAGRG